jgi:hypothetical protein
MPNAAGVSISGARSNTIGGATASARNVISGNTSAGVSIIGDNSRKNVVYGNRIGTDAAGTAPIPNGTGVFIGGGAQSSRIGSGTLANGNVIRFNSGDGVVVDANDGATQLDSIAGNSIDSNGGLGISLVAGANEEQPSPVIEAANATVIEGSLDTFAASTDYRIEFFSSPSCDPSGAGEGRSYLGFANVTTDSAGHASFSKTVAAHPSEQAVTATASMLGGGRLGTDAETSEFSLCAFSS